MGKQFGYCSKGHHFWLGKWFLFDGTWYRHWMCVSREDHQTALWSDYKIGPTIEKEKCELLRLG